MGVKLAKKLKRKYIFLNYNLALNKITVFTFSQARKMHGSIMLVASVCGAPF